MSVAMGEALSVEPLRGGHTAPPHPDDGPIPGLVWGFRIDENGKPSPFDPGDERNDQWIWLHFNLADRRAQSWLEGSGIVRPEGLELLFSPDDAQRLIARDGCVMGVFFDLAREFDHVSEEFGHLRFVMSERALVSGRRRPLRAVEGIRREIERGRPMTSVVDLMGAIVEEVARGIEGIVDQVASDLDLVEDAILKNEAEDHRDRLGRGRLTMVRVHRRLNGLRTLFRRFAGETPGGLAERVRVPASQLVQRLDDLDHEVVELRDRARLLQEEVSIRLAEETNRHLHALAVITAVLLPPTLVTGVFGMNFTAEPLTSSGGGFWWALIIIVGSSAFAMWLLARSGIIGKRRR